jgi:hypothetical protein
VPSYLDAALILVTGSFVLVTVLPAPRMPAVRAGLLCFWLMSAGVLAFVVAVVIAVLAMLTTIPAYVVFAPIVAVGAIGLALWLTMFWLAAAPSPGQERADGDGPDGDDGGGGGGPPPADDPPRHPGPPEGIPWDVFDREREAWEAARAPARGREPAGV